MLPRLTLALAGGGDFIWGMLWPLLPAAFSPPPRLFRSPLLPTGRFSPPERLFLSPPPLPETPSLSPWPLVYSP